MNGFVDYALIKLSYRVLHIFFKTQANVNPKKIGTATIRHVPCEPGLVVNRSTIASLRINPKLSSASISPFRGPYCLPS